MSLDAQPTPRLHRIRDAIAGAGVDALLVGSPHNRRYASGFSGSNGWLLIGADQARIATDFRYWDQANQESPDFELVQSVGPMTAWWQEFAAPFAGARIGFEADHLTVASLERLHEANDKIDDPNRPALVRTDSVIELVRSEKDAAELDALRRAAHLTDDAFADVASRMQPDWTELRVAWELEQYARLHGAEGMAFDSIVAAGPWGARPHARPRDEPVGEGRPIVIDMGVRIDGYCADMTRTIVLGQPDDRFAEIYDIVLAAHETAAQTVEPGMAAKDAHQIAQSVIDHAGYGDKFGHGLGHGVGLQIHEHPYLGATSEDELADGMVITIEPGIYLPDWGGVRIEDMGVLQDGCFQSFAQSPKLRMIGSNP